MVTEITIAIVSGAGGVLLSRLVPSKDKKIDEGTEIRQELYRVAHELRHQMRELGQELDQWKDRYYKLLREHNEVLNEYHAQKKLNNHYEGKIQYLQKKVNELKKEVDTLKRAQ